MSVGAGGNTTRKHLRLRRTLDGIAQRVQALMMIELAGMGAGGFEPPTSTV